MGEYVFPRKMAEDASAMLAYNCKQIRAVTEVCTLIYVFLEKELELFTCTFWIIKKRIEHKYRVASETQSKHSSYVNRVLSGIFFFTKNVKWENNISLDKDDSNNDINRFKVFINI